jgi:transposase
MVWFGALRGGWGQGVGTALAIRTDVEAAELRRLARRERDGRAAARLIAMANVLDGMSRDAAARSAGMDRQTLRDWMIRCVEPRGSPGNAEVGRASVISPARGARRA